MFGMSENASTANTFVGETAEFDRLAQLVHEVTGFRNGPGLRCKLASIVGGCDEDTANTWLRRLAPRWVSGGEWQTVLERLMVSETFFFRDGPQIDLLRQRVLPQMISAKMKSGDRTLRVWSAGCSTGEEPYTLAMLILDALVAAGQAVELPGGGVHLTAGWTLNVHGTDINAKVVDRARTGLYSDFGLSSFRETPPEFRRFFVRHDPTTTATRFAIRQDVRNVTGFGVHNLTSGPVGTGFDLVSCRNVLIYFDDDSKRLALAALAGAVARGGTLMLGPTDPFDSLARFDLLDSRISPVLARVSVPGGQP